MEMFCGQTVEVAVNNYHVCRTTEKNMINNKEHKNVFSEWEKE